MAEPFDMDHSQADGDLAWRETYVVLFESVARPTLTQVEATIGDANRRLKMENLKADDDGLFQSVLVQAEEDNAALDIRYEEGPAVSDRVITLADQLRDELNEGQMAQLLQADAWLEVMHFEKVESAGEFDEAEPEEDFLGPGGLDPATLITVVEAIAHLTDGLPVNPTAGELLM